MQQALVTQDSDSTTIIDSRYCGPPTSGNGGYSCGIVANELGATVEVTLLRPPPLDQHLRFEHHEEGMALFHNDLMIAKAKPSTLELDPPTAPSFEHAKSLAARYSGYETHAFPTCFVCGPKRDASDGLCIFPTKESPETPAVAAWTPHASVCDDSGLTRKEIVWAALDCPGYFGVAELGEAAVLGRMTGTVYTQPRRGERCVVLGWAIKREGRKLHAGTALYGAEGDVYAVSQQTWIKINV